ncbi:MAG TPA: DUF3822 family protein [Flavobacterium sp.]
MRDTGKSMAGNTDITEKKYRKLVLQASLNGLSFCCLDTLNQSVLCVKDIDFSKFPRAKKVEDYYWQAFVDNMELTRTYDEVAVIHDNNLNTFVPKALFDQDYLGSYLQYNTKVFETDFFDYDDLESYEMNNVYIPYVNINNYLIDQFGSFEYKHTATILASQILGLSKNNEEKLVYVHFSKYKFEIIVVQNQKLILFNSFDYRTKEDFIYYLLFAAEQLNLNPENFKLYLLGDISEDSEYFKIAWKYVRNVSIVDVTETENRSGLSKAESVKHFILLQG